MTPNRAVRKLISRAAKALTDRPEWLALLAGAVVAGVLTLALLRVNTTTRSSYISALAISDPSMTAISTMLERGDLWGASTRVESSYRFDRPAGLLALRRFSVLVLRRGLQERDPYERCYAISALAAAGDRSQIAKLVSIFARAQATGLKMAVADGLGDVGDADAVEALGRLYHSAGPSDEWIIVNGLAEAHDPSAIELLSRSLNVSDRATRLAAERGLGQLGNHGAVPILRRSLAATRDSFEKANIGYSLLRLGDRSAEQMVEAILRGHVDGNARAMAALALGRAGDPRVVGLLRAAMNDNAIDVRIGAAVALTHYADPAGTEYLRAAIRDQDSMTRLHVGQLLDELEFRNAREVVTAAAVSDDPELSMQGIRAIGLSGSDREVEFLIRLADTASDPITRAEVAWALGRIGGASSVAPLIAMVAEPDHTVRYTAADALDRAAIGLLENAGAGGA
ncbi:MAG TPA: HEAT repeat domain-containing protein [Candidatus Binataceae bacterium]|nr:HEAT repeat domain-containing protein [Candidatus Binataceae bacterium]